MRSVLLALLLVAACGGRGRSGVPDGSTDSGSGSDGGGVDAAVLEGGGGTEGGGGVPVVGRISLASDVGSALATVRFYGDEGHFDPMLGERCQLVLLDSGRCAHRRCEADTVTPNVHAGVVRFADGPDMVAWTPDTNGVYAGSVGDWMPGDMIVVSADGATAPAFTTTVTMPPRVELFPTLPSPVDRTAPAVITHVPITSDIRIQIESVGAGVTNELSCARDGASGSATIGPELLAVLPPGPASFSAFPLATSTVVDGTYRVDVLAASRASAVAQSIVIE